MIAQQQGEVGHLEGDLISGSYYRSAIITVFDRKSRYLWLQKLPDSHSADNTLKAVVVLLKRIPEPLRKTLTWDRGTEMARHQDIAKQAKIDLYFADPSSPWQRPTNEIGNGLIRRYVGKGGDLNRYTTRQLRQIENRINTMPRRIHNWKTAKHIYDQAVALTG